MIKGVDLKAIVRQAVSEQRTKVKTMGKKEDCWKAGSRNM